MLFIILGFVVCMSWVRLDKYFPCLFKEKDTRTLFLIHMQLQGHVQGHVGIKNPSRAEEVVIILLLFIIHQSFYCL